MRAGTLRHRVVIQQNTPTRDTYGAEVASWGTLATVWGAVEPLSGREFWQAQTINAQVTTRIRIRYRSGIVPTMRATWDSHTYDILSVIELETKRRELHLMCKELL